MMTSRDPGELGIYGFRNRSDYGYDKLSVADSGSFREDTVWDILGREGKDSIIIGVPPTYPVKPLRGSLISCFLTPGSQSQFTYPHDLRPEVQRLVGDYMVDVKGFRTDKKQWLLSQIYEMTTKRFSVAKHFLKTRPWDFFMMVEMGTDRIHHGFWQFMDEQHVLYAGAPDWAADWTGHRLARGSFFPRRRTRKRATLPPTSACSSAICIGGRVEWWGAVKSTASTTIAVRTAPTTTGMGFC